MTDKDAFLAHIRANHKDDVARLAFADFAEEHLNYRFWPRLIRAQIQRQGEWKYEAWNCSSPAAHEMGLDKLGELGQYDYNTRRNNVRIAVHPARSVGNSYDVVIDRGLPRQLIYGADLDVFVKQAGKLFAWPIVSVLTTAKPDEEEATPESGFGYVRSFDWWTDESYGTGDGGFRLPHALFEKLLSLYVPSPGVHPEEPDLEDADVHYIEFEEFGNAVYALKRAMMDYGREAYKESLKKPSRKRARKE